MTPPRLTAGILAAATALAISSCAPIRPEAGKSPLRRPRMSPDSVTLDVFFARFSFGDGLANQTLWQQVDEQHVPPEVRRELVANGFRVGLIGGQVPEALAELMELDESPPPAPQSLETNVADLEGRARVVRRHMPLRSGHRGLIPVSGIYDELPVLMQEDGELCGRSYQKAQGVFAVKAFPEPDGRVRIELVPEVQYGDPRQRPVFSQGVMRLESGRPSRAFAKLAVEATLSPGDMLVATSLPNRPGSLGHSFFSQVTGGEKEQKLLIIRLAQTQHDDLFAPTSPLPLEELDD